MKLAELKELEGAAEVLERRAKELRACASEIGTIRRGPNDLLAAIARLTQPYSYAAKKTALDAAAATLRDDLLRIAELDLEAQARRAMAESRARRAAIAIYCEEPAPEPEKATPEAVA